MKTTKLFLMAALALTFAACSNDDNEIQNPAQPAKTEGIPFTATISVANSAATRALDDKGTKIEATWATGEQVALIYTVGSTTYVKAATVTPQTGGTATISTELDGSPADDTDVTIVYPATAVDETTKDVKANLLTSQNGQLTGDGSISKNYDLRKTTTPAKLKIDGTTASLKGPVTLAQQVSIWKLTMQDNAATPAAVTATKVTIKNGGTVIAGTTTISATSSVYLAVPAASGANLSITAATASGVYAYSKSGVTLSAGNYYQSTVTMTATGEFASLFSVSATKQVHFSKGNLQATTTDGGTNWTWAFAANQWEYIGNATANTSINGNGTVSANGTVDLFGWSTSATTYGIHNSKTVGDYSGDFKDWGETMGTGWRTLSSAEWTYLFNTRTVNGGTGSGKSYIWKSVNSVEGIVIYPDDYAGASYSGSDWPTFEAAGCVFLPAAGHREGTTVSYTGSWGNYWTSTLYSTDYPCRVCFASSYFNPAYSDRNRSNGLSVRLVRDVD